MSTELKPCPFCGNLPVEHQVGTNNTKTRRYEIICKTKGCVQITVGVIRNSLEWAREQAITAWNTRAHQYALVDALKASEVMLSIMLKCWGDTSTNNNGKFRNITTKSTLDEVRAVLVTLEKELHPTTEDIPSNPYRPGVWNGTSAEVEMDDKCVGWKDGFVGKFMRSCRSQAYEQAYTEGKLLRKKGDEDKCGVCGGNHADFMIHGASLPDRAAK